jgi:hypothetical protein
MTESIAAYVDVEPSDPSTDWLDPKDQTTYKATIAPDGSCKFERKDWDQVGATHPKFKVFVPLMGLVSNGCVEDFFDQLGQVFDSRGKPRVVEIVEARGRCVKVSTHDWNLPAWRDMAEFLMGTGRPCEDFLVTNHNTLYARLKTAAAYEAEQHVKDLGGLVWEFRSGFVGFMSGVDAVPAAVAAPASAAGRRKKKVPGGAATVVLKTMEGLSPVGAIDTEKLIAETVKHMPATRDKRGQDRRKDYAARAVAKLTELGFLHVHGDEQEQISLTALIVDDTPEAA